MEAVKGFANSKDRGIISSPGLRSNVIRKRKRQSSRPSGETLVIKLEHH
ncbi:MAG TPA: hypothetical protein VE961_26185 [Pyrinomonadaceae bacterium]|nr:hypothetical protein [Pyrinomonadaceae bacterium]